MLGTMLNSSDMIGMFQFKKLENVFFKCFVLGFNKFLKIIHIYISFSKLYSVLRPNVKQVLQLILF